MTLSHAIVGELANILLNATGTPASAFKARGIPEAMKVIELMGIEQSRQWGTCSLNEFRRFMGLKPYDSFAEWNPDPEVHVSIYLSLFFFVQSTD